MAVFSCELSAKIKSGVFSYNVEVFMILCVKAFAATLDDVFTLIISKHEHI